MRRLPLPLAVFLTFQGLFALTATGRVDRVADEFEVYLQVESLWEEQSLAIDRRVSPQVFFGATGRDGRKYAPYGPGAAFASLGHHALGRGLVAGLGLSRATDRQGYTDLLALVTSLSTSTWAALAVLGLFCAARALGGSERRALALAGLLGLGSFLWPYGGWFYSEPIAAALLLWAVVWHLQRRPWLAAGALLALALVKATHASAAAGLIGVAWWSPERRGDAVRYVGAIVAAALIHAGYNWVRFGDALDFGYRWTESGLFGLSADGSPAKPNPFTLSRLPQGLAGLLLSPGKSILLFLPGLVLLADPARWRAWRGSRWVYTLGLGGLVAGLAFFGSYFFWEGGYAFGPRHLLPAAPLGLLPLARGPLRGYRAALGVGCVVALLGAGTPFLEDQALGEDLTQPREIYYRIDHDAAPGAPKNVYRLGYVPWGRAAARFGSGLVSRDPESSLRWLGPRLHELGHHRLALAAQALVFALLAIGGCTIAGSVRKSNLTPAPIGTGSDS